jgi:hypothetical protein
MRIERGAGGEVSLAAAAELLATAKFPVILAGGGVVMGDAVEECKALAERLGAPVVNGYLRNDAFPASHPLWAGPLGYQGSKAAMKLIAQADVVIALGSRMGPFGTLPQHGMDYWPKDAKIIQVEADHTNARPGEEDPRRHLRRRQGRGQARCRAAGRASWPATRPRRERAKKIAAEKAAWEKELDEWTHERDAYSLDMIERPRSEKTFNGGNYLHPRQVLRELEKAMPARDGLHRHRQHQLGGQQLPALRGAAQLLRADELRQLRLCAADDDRRQGGLRRIGRPSPTPATAPGRMSMTEIMTCVRHDIPVTAVVFHNRQWGAEKKNQVDFYNRRFVAGELDNQSFAGIARHGRRGHRRRQARGRRPGAEEGIDLQMNEGKTCVIEIMCTRELGDPFRRDALAKPVRCSTSTRTMSEQPPAADPATPTRLRARERARQRRTRAGAGASRRCAGAAGGGGDGATPASPGPAGGRTRGDPSRAGQAGSTQAASRSWPPGPVARPKRSAPPPWRWPARAWWQALMKGSLHTDELMSAVVAATDGLRGETPHHACFRLRPAALSQAAGAGRLRGQHRAQPENQAAHPRQRGALLRRWAWPSPRSVW